MNGKPIRVLFVLDIFVGRGGTERQFELLIKNIDRSECVPHIVAMRAEPGSPPSIADVPICALGVASLRSPASWWKLVCFLAWVRRQRFHVAHLFFNDCALWLPFPLWLLNVRVVVARRDLGFWYSKTKLRVLRFNRRFVSRVVANCQAVACSVAAAEGYDLSRIEVILNGLFRPPREFAGRHSRNVASRYSLAVVANLRPLKRISDAVRTLAKLRRKGIDVDLVVVGEDGPTSTSSSHLAELQALAESEGVGGSVRFVGAVDDPMPYVLSADVCLLLSESEGLSNAVMEYMSAGRPVVCTDVGGNPELVTEACNGYLIPVGNVDVCCDRVERLLRRPELRESFGRMGRMMADNLLQAQGMAQAHVKLYRALLPASEDEHAR